MAVTVRELEKIRREGLKALKEKLGVEGMIKFIQMYSDGKGDYTQEREELLKDVTIEDFEKFLSEKNESNVNRNPVLRQINAQVNRCNSQPYLRQINA